uniref:Uncharacterized protein n=1 Tax=Noctiluca scintillans TaxID=2966 RepID=A0A7S1FD00_NOCSC|mmetsp:Transcript_50782/g.135454  ORF Transcript_50782/g.135454 Transcript_50782/m.135454 type:complete len:297 (+) Transcript_50782:54-944(+)
MMAVFDEVPWTSVVCVVSTQLVLLATLYPFLGKRSRPDVAATLAKRKCETWFLQYAVFWVVCFTLIIGLQLFEAMGKWSYLGVCGGLAAPLLLQPIIAPAITGEAGVPLLQRHCTKANCWLAIYSFLGNYWGTHYFYCVLGARYTLLFLPDHQLNGVALCMYFATHFYFALYHALGNRLLRWARESFEPSFVRSLFVISLICVAAYVVAFMETLSIAAFPYYTFDDRQMMYSVGSAFYGVYLVISFPMYARLDEVPNAPPHTLMQTCLESLGSWMIIMCLLDFLRLSLGIEFRMAP